MQTFTIGQDVTCVHRGYGRVANVFKEGVSEPVYVVFEDGSTGTFTLDGKARKRDLLPSLFSGRVKPADFVSVTDAINRPDPETLTLDQPLYVCVNGAYVIRHFAKHEAGRVSVWANGATSYTAPPNAVGTVVSSWRLPTVKEMQLARQR